MVKCALCFRGKCLDINLSSHSNTLYKVDFKKGIQSIFEKVINENPSVEFDFYLHGWIYDESYIEEILEYFKPKKYILEKQKDFINDYKNIENYSDILKERYKHLHKKNKYNYNNINFQDYFQNIFSYSYSISKVIELIPDNIDYDYIIHLRYDVVIDKKINLNQFDDKIYTDNLKNKQSPLYYGDFIYCSTKKNTIFMKNFYNFLKNNIFNNYEYKEWVKNIIKNKPKNAIGRYNHGIYSNQMIYAYFITKNSIQYENVVSKIDCHLIRNKI